MSADENRDLLEYFASRPVSPVGDERIGAAWLHFCRDHLNADEQGRLVAFLGKPIATIDAFDYYELPAKAKRRFADWLEEIGECRCIVYDDPHGAPAWMLMEPEDEQLLPATTPLLHFTDNANAIRSEGFRFGVPDIDRIALTYEHSVFGGLPNRLRHDAPGYNFAYPADGSVDLAARAGSYGAQAVLFLGEGLPVHHQGDRERQVVFWGPSADMSLSVAITRQGERWVSDTGSGGKDLNRLVRRLAADLRALVREADARPVEAVTGPRL